MKIVLPNNIAEEYELKMGYKRVEIFVTEATQFCVTAGSTLMC